MVKRCAFYMEDGVIIRRDVSINWNKGFTRDAKLDYIQQIAAGLRAFGDVIDVTTASLLYKNKLLSPYYTKVKGVSTEEYWRDFKAGLKEYVPGMFEFVYLSSLSVEQQAYVLMQNGFSDVFYKPESNGNTQAKALAVLKLLHSQGRGALLGSMEDFLDWYKNNCASIKVQIIS